MKISLLSWFWMACSIASYSCGEYYSKKVAENFSWFYISCIIAGYVGSGAFWIPAMIQRNGLIVLGLIWTLAAASATLLIGKYMGEVLNTYQLVGVVLAIIAAVLLSL